MAIRQKRRCVVCLSFLKHHDSLHLRRKSPLPSVHHANSHPRQGVITFFLFAMVPNSIPVMPITKNPCFLSWNVCINYDIEYWDVFFHNLLFSWILGFIWRNVVEVGNNLFFVFLINEQLRTSNICGILTWSILTSDCTLPANASSWGNMISMKSLSGPSITLSDCSQKTLWITRNTVIFTHLVMGSHSLWLWKIYIYIFKTIKCVTAVVTAVSLCVSGAWGLWRRNRSVADVLFNILSWLNTSYQ